MIFLKCGRQWLFDQLHYLDHSLFEPVLRNVGVRHHRADTVFAETRWFDA